MKRYCEGKGNEEGNRKGKGKKTRKTKKRKKNAESEGEEEKKHNAINNEEKDGSNKLDRSDWTIDDWFKVRITMDRVLKKQKEIKASKTKSKEKLEQQN